MTPRRAMSYRKPVPEYIPSPTEADKSDCPDVPPVCRYYLSVNDSTPKLPTDWRTAIMINTAIMSDYETDLQVVSEVRNCDAIELHLHCQADEIDSDSEISPSLGGRGRTVRQVSCMKILQVIDAFQEF